MSLNRILKIEEEIDVFSKQFEEYNQKINNLNHRIQEIKRRVVEQIMHNLALANRRPDLKKRRRA